MKTIKYSMKNFIMKVALISTLLFMSHYYLLVKKCTAQAPTPCNSPTVVTTDFGYDIGNSNSNNSNFFFGNSNPGLANCEGDVVIGSIPCTTICPSFPRAKLDVTQQAILSPSPGSIGIIVENKDNAGCTTYPVIGIKSIVDGPSSQADARIAGWFEADNSPNCCSGTTQCAIYVPQNGGNVSIGYNLIGYYCSNYVNYTLDVNGTINASVAYYNVSDSSLKKNISPLGNTLNKVAKLRPVSYDFKETHDMAGKGKHYGFLAQEVGSLFPYAIRVLNGRYSLSYNELIPILTVAIQQEKQTNDSLRSELQSIQQCVNQLCTVSTQNGTNPFLSNVQEVNLVNINSVVLYQNIPNPFGSGGTKINYYLPEGSGHATIVFFDSYGNKLNETTISKTGNGTLNINSEKLSSGIYSYSLILNGQVIDTKRMILTK